MVNIRIALENTTPLDRTIQRLRSPDPIFKAWANHIEGLAVQAFKNEAAPYGADWQPLSPQYLAHKQGYARRVGAKKRKAKRRGEEFRDRRGSPKKGGALKLRWTGALYDSIYARVDGDVVIAGSNLAVGSYSLGAIHQFGAPARNIPARPFLPVDAEGEPLPQLVDELTQMAIDYLQG
jgi:phage gpG-like protein